MIIVHLKSGKTHKVQIEKMEKEDWVTVKNSREFDFDWNREKGYTVYKLQHESTGEILGLISIEDIPMEYRLHIRLIESSNKNKGKNKDYDRIAGCLIGYACKLALEKKAYEGFVSLESKTELIPLYRDKYGFQEMGKFMYSELTNSENLVTKYLEDE